MSLGNLINDVVNSVEQLKGLIYHSVCSGMAASTTTIIVPELANLGNDYFNTDWVMKILKNANSVGNAPEGEIRDITDYVSSSGRFTTSAFSQNVESNDIVIVAKRELFLVDALALKTTPITNSLAYRLSQFLASGDGDWATGQPLPSNTSLVDIAGDFTGPHNGAAQDDNIKASLDLAHTDLDTIISQTAAAILEGEAEDALEGENLDHLLMLDGATQKYPEQCATDSILAKVIAKGDPAIPSTYNCTTDSLEMLSDKLGAFSGDGGAAQDDSSKASLDLVHTEIAALPTDADVNTEVDTALNTIVPASPIAGSLNDILSKAAGANTFNKATDSLESLGEDSDAILADTNELQTDWTNGGRLDLLIDAILARTSYGTIVRKTVAFDGGAGNGAIGTVALFTVTGDVRVKLTAICSETLVGAATLECGVSGNTAGIIAQIVDATALIANEIWFDATPTTTLDDDSAIPRKVIAAGQDIILTIGAANITDGTIKFVVEFEALSIDGAVVAA